MKAIIEINKTPLTIEITPDSQIGQTVNDIISGRLEVPELTNYFYKLFDENAKAWEYQNMVQH